MPDTATTATAIHGKATHSSMTELQRAYAQEFERLEGDLNGRLATQSYLNGSTAVYHGQVIGMGYLPKLYDAEALALLERTALQTYAILSKMTRHFCKDASYRSLFRFSPLLEQLILLPSGYDCSIPICRIDIFFDENNGSFKFCEFNTDGTSAMNEDREVVDALATAPLLQNFATSNVLYAQELFDPWVETFMRLYESCAFARPNPRVAIIDYMQNAVVDEQLEFRKRFERHGVSCLVCDVSTLECVNGVLFGRDISKDHPAYEQPQRIDAVYRRAVTFELLEELQKAPELAQSILAQKGTASIAESSTPLCGAFALLAAVVRQSTCLIGSFATQVAHSKAVFCMLHHPQTLELLTPEERQFVAEHVPYTTWLTEESIDIDKVKTTRENWIIKPVDGYGSVGVQAGMSFNQKDWEELIDEKLKENYVVQEYCAQFQTLNTLPVPYDDAGTLKFNKLPEAQELIDQGEFDPGALEPYNILTGLYCYGGAFGGIYVRAGRDALIVGFRGGVTLGSLLVDYEPPPGSLHRARAILD